MPARRVYKKTRAIGFRPLPSRKAVRAALRNRNRMAATPVADPDGLTAEQRAEVNACIASYNSRNAESKRAQYYNYDKSVWTLGSTNFPSTNIFPVGIDPTSFTITQGAGQGQRIGNKIKTKKLMFKGTLNALQYNAITNDTVIPAQVKMYIFYDKTVPTAVPNPIAAVDWFQNGNSVKSFQNDLADLWSPVNDDRYRVVASRTFKLGFSTSNGTGSSPDFQYLSNNDFKYNANFSFDLTKHYPKFVKFNDGTAVPTTRGLFCMIVPLAASGGPYGSQRIPVSVAFMLDYHFEDE